jgi:lipopolysaccharide transport system ATP-binding protein
MSKLLLWIQYKMSDIVISIENLSKRYRLGVISTNTFKGDLTRWWAKRRGKPDPYMKIGDSDNSHRDGETIWALHDINFTVKHGEALGIIGRNGAGKSTLLKILSRVTAPTSGVVKVKGRIASLLEVGTGFHPELTGRENIFLNGAIMGMSRIEVNQKFDEIVDFSGVEQFIDTPVKRYSSGMYVRLAFAVAAHLEPEILIVDEVLAVGDAEFQKKCLNKMQDVGKEGRTVLFVSHNMSAITRLCQRTILLDEGKILSDGLSHQVVSFYLRAGTSAKAERKWQDIKKAPGNEIARLSAVRIRNEAENISDTFDIREPIKIEIEYYNYVNDRFPYANIQLLNEQGVCIFASGDFTNSEWRHKPRKFTGKVTSTCIIPGNLLSEGMISVLVGLTTHNPTEVLAIEQDAVSFIVVDHSKGDGARGEYVGDFPGIVRPLLKWHVLYEATTTKNSE